MNSDSVIGMVDNHFVKTVTIDDLLYPKDQIGVAAIITQNRIEIFDNPDCPFTRCRSAEDLWGG